MTKRLPCSRRRSKFLQDDLFPLFLLYVYLYMYVCMNGHTHTQGFVGTLGASYIGHMVTDARVSPPGTSKN